ncbi:TOBE domain-containing protein, partial [Telluria sp. Tellsp104]
RGRRGVLAGGARWASSPRPAMVWVAGFSCGPMINRRAAAAHAQGRLALGGVPLDWRGPAASGTHVTVGVRPEHLVPDAAGPIRGVVALVERLGAESHVHLDVAGLSRPLVAAIRDAPPPPGSAWAVAPAAGALHVFVPDGKRIDNNFNQQEEA